MWFFHDSVDVTRPLKVPMKRVNLHDCTIWEPSPMICLTTQAHQRRCRVQGERVLRLAGQRELAERRNTEMPQTEEQILTTGEAANLCGVSRSTLRRAVAQG